MFYITFYFFCGKYFQSFQIGKKILQKQFHSLLEDLFSSTDKTTCVTGGNDLYDLKNCAMSKRIVNTKRRNPEGNTKNRKNIK